MLLLTRPRVTLFAVLLAALNLLALLFIWAGSSGGLDYDGRPVGTDFIAFWCAGWLALHGQLALGDGLHTFSSLHPLAPAGQDQVLLWTYPPPFLLLLAPLALLPYLPAVLAFTGTTFTAALATARAYSRDKLALLLLIGAPATLMSLLTGQTGLLLGAAAGAGLIWRERRPWLAGFGLSLLVIKPHLMVLLPLFLLLQRDYKTLVSTSLFALLWCLISWAYFGTESWLVFLQHMPAARAILENGTAAWEKMGSAYVSVRLLGGGNLLAWAIHGLVSLLALWLALPCLQRRDSTASIALLLLAFVISPYQFDYDLVMLLPALALWAQRTQGLGDEMLIALLYLAPVLSPALALSVHLGLLPLLLLAALHQLYKHRPTAAPASAHPQ